MPEVQREHWTNVPGTDTYYPSTAKELRVAYPEQREDDMGETSIHIKLVTSLLWTLILFFKNRPDVFVSGNMNLYWEEGNPDKWLAPDLLVAFGVPAGERSIFQVWREGVCPQVIFEVASKRTWRADVSDKLEIYSDLGVEEYYLLDPSFEFLPMPMMAFHREGDRLIGTRIENDRVLSKRLGIEIVRDDNTFRLFDPVNAEFLLTLDDADARIKELEAEIARLKNGRND